MKPQASRHHLVHDGIGWARVQMISFIIIFQVALSVVVIFGGVASGQVKLQQEQQQWQAPNADWKLSAAEDSWTFWWSHSGPSFWGLLNVDWRLCDKGRRQSPLNIDTKQLIYDQSLSALWIGGEQVINGLLQNDGHTIIFNFTAAAILAKAQPLSEDQQLGSAPNDKPSSTSALKINDEANQSKPANDNGQAPENRIDTSSTNYSNNFDEATPDDQNKQQQQEAVEENNSNTESIVDAAPTFSGAGLGYSYKLDSLSLKFGAGSANKDNQFGSEHQINGIGHDAELQIFAYNSLLYRNFYEASMRPNGLLAIAVLVTAIPTTPSTDAVSEMSAHQSTASASNKYNTATSSANNIQMKPNSALDQIVSKLNLIKYRNQQTLIEAFNVSQLLAGNQDSFVIYDGSLTKPACFESVTWILLNKPLYIRQSALDNLRLISADEQSNGATGTLIAGNVRPIQQTNGRPIRTNIKPNNQEACSKFMTRFEYTLSGSPQALKTRQR